MPVPGSDGEYSLETVPVYLTWESTRATARPVGYLLPTSMASVVPLLLDHDIAVYKFVEPTSIDAEVYYATDVNRDNYFQGHYLQSVEVEKELETVEVDHGWYWIPTAQSRGRLITYLMEPETDDNLITWGWTDHILQVTPESVEAVIAGSLQGVDPSTVPADRMERLRERAQRQMERKQRVPMMRVMMHQRLPVVRVKAFNEYQRRRFYRAGG